MPMSQGLKHEHRLDGRVEIAAAYDALSHGAQSTLLVFEHSLEHLGMESPATIEGLNRLVRRSPANRVHFILHETRYCEAYCPRLISLQRRFSTQIEFRRTVGAARAVYDAFMVADEKHYVRRFHRDQWRGERGVDHGTEATNLVHRFNELWEASERVLTSTVIGL